MRRLLLIQMALLSLVSAIPQEDLSLLKQVELMSERTYNLIIQNKLEFCTNTAKLVVDCKAANGTELERWQHWLDLSDAGRINTTEKAIKKYIDRLGRSRAKPYDPYIPSKELQESLNRCTKDAFEDKQSKYLQSKYNILKSFENEARPLFQEVTNATRQSDKFLFESFDHFVKKGNETIFMYFRSKIINYEDRALLIEVKDLAEETNLQLQRIYMKYSITEIEAIISCNAVNQTELENLKILLDLIKKCYETLTDDQFWKISYLLAANMPQFDQRKAFLERLNNCTPGIMEELEAKIAAESEEKIDAFTKNAIPKMHQLSQNTKQVEKGIFKILEVISNPNREFKVRHDKFVVLRAFFEYY